MAYDVLAVRAQRQEASGAKPWPFTIGDAQFTLPPEPPAELLPYLAELSEHLDGAKPDDPLPTQIVVATPKILDTLLGPADAARLAAHRLSIQDVAALLMSYFGDTVGGGGLGESSPSPTSSPSTPRTPKRTSKRTTGSRSPTTTKATAR